MKDDHSINIPGYTWYGNNRTALSNRAVRGSGGVGILVKNNILKDYDVIILDRGFEGIIWLQLTSKFDSSFCIYICVVYLIPEGSSRGNIAQEFYDMLLSQVYMYYEENPLVIMGDLNGRIGDAQDFNAHIDNGDIRKRDSIDHVKNRYGDYLVDFLGDSKMCTLNGRFDQDKDNYTYVTPRGKSVVDYMIMPHTHFNIIQNFEVVLVSEAIDKYGIDFGSASIPDHSIIRCNINIAYNKHKQDYVDNKNNQVNHDMENDNSYMSRKYITNNIPADIFTNERAARAIIKVIEKIENAQDTKQSVDEVYQEFVDIVHAEMENKLSYKIRGRKSTRKNGRRHRKHWWNDELSNLWQIVKHNENLYLQCNGTRDEVQQQKTHYKESRRLFDKKARQAERTYKAKQRDRITQLQATDPKTFWNEVQKLGPVNRKQEIDSVVLQEGNISYNANDIVTKWKHDFSKLFSDNTNSSQVSDKFLEDTRALIIEWEQELDNIRNEQDSSENYVGIQETNDQENDIILNSEITQEEVTNALKQAKSNKATGIENIPNEILKNTKLTDLLLKLFRKCFENSILPSMWDYSIIYPILKKGKDYRNPLSYRSISLMSTVAKVFNSIICKRISDFLDSNDLLVEEQNGFRKLRSCIEHIYSLYTVLRNRKENNLETFVCYIDFAKAFDSVNHDLLFAKLLSIGVTGKIYKTVKAMYKNLKSCVQIDTLKTDWFSVERGVRQGDSLAPLLFAIYINDLAVEIKRLDLGVCIGRNEKLCILMYADDIVLIAESEEELQQMLDVLSKWSDVWRLQINIDKTKVMHCRKQSVEATDYNFEVLGKNISLCSTYRYLGFEISDTVNFTDGIKTLAEAGSRALGSLISKHFNSGGLSFQVYEKLYYSTVVPVTDYASEIWGFKKRDIIDKIQYRAIRTILGVGKRAPLPYLTGETGWLEAQNRHHISVVRLWLRITQMTDNRLPKIIYLWDKQQNMKNSWAKEVRTIMERCDLIENYEQNSTNGMNNSTFLELVKQRICLLAADKWSNDVQAMPKLRTYAKLKTEFGTVQLLNKQISGKQRSAISKMRSGTFPIYIETGRYRQIPAHLRLCKLCNYQEVEDEYHFMMNCTAYSRERQMLLETLGRKLNVETVQMTKDEIFKTLLCSPDVICDTASYILSAFSKRANLL